MQAATALSNQPINAITISIASASSGNTKTVMTSHPDIR
ncbi:hypothetical protein Nizo1840_2408 [Lactiplantibacillus plantarum]|nr:hypothetical protein SF2A35B_2184 [Lactiplantibacillus plantarum]KZT80891.1 hypothetical protein Nizo1840_2408 [Lactiplantibacillus plantarum]KZT82963.1 hypothetical protein Nizo1839_0520 [Lactiplantibacillus plantarum]KZU11853.1 hypothetical protein Nizo2264_2431 [Lactiplantibacillus plantarum]